MAQETITITISNYERRMLYDMKDKYNKLDTGELALAGDILLSNME